MSLFWKILFFSTAVQGLFVSVLIAAQPKFKAAQNRWLISLLLAFTITISYYIAFWLGLTAEWPAWSQVPLLLVLTFGPSLYFFLFDPKPNTRSLVLHFSPLLFALLLFTIRITTNTAEIAYGTIVLELVQLGAYSAFFLIKNKAQFKWLGFAFTGYSLLFMSYYILVWTNLLTIHSDYMVSLGMSVFVYSIAYWVFVKTPDTKEESKYANSALTDNTINYLLEKADSLLLHEELYKDNSLKLVQFAETLGVSGHDFSQAINKGRSSSFNDYINEWRVNKAIELMKSERFANETLLAIGIEVGFNNKTSFLNAFKRFTKLTPSQYRQQLLAQAS